MRVAPVPTQHPKERRSPSFAAPGLPLCAQSTEKRRRQALQVHGRAVCTRCAGKVSGQGGRAKRLGVAFVRARASAEVNPARPNFSACGGVPACVGIHLASACMHAARERGRGRRRTDQPSRHRGRSDSCPPASRALPRSLLDHRHRHRHRRHRHHPRALPLSPTVPARCQPPRDAPLLPAPAAPAVPAATPPHRRTAASRPLLPSPSPVTAQASISAAAGGAVRRPPLPSHATIPIRPPTRRALCCRPMMPTPTAETDAPRSAREISRQIDLTPRADWLLPDRAGGPSRVLHVCMLNARRRAGCAPDARDLI